MKEMTAVCLTVDTFTAFCNLLPPDSLVWELLWVRQDFWTRLHFVLDARLKAFEHRTLFAAVVWLPYFFCVTIAAFLSPSVMTTLTEENGMLVRKLFHALVPIGNESVPKITVNNTINLFFFKLQSAFW